MSGLDKKIHPAFKHGAYSALGLLPGESPTAFEKLRRDVFAELKPNGPLEEDEVETISCILWRKKNLQTFQTAALAKEYWRKVQRDRVPHDIYESLMALPEPKLIKSVDPVVHREALQAAESDMRKELGEIFDLVEIAEIASIEQLEHELALLDGLKARMGKCIKHLLQLRGFKSLSVEPSSGSAKP
jgi:hypothetical protein